MRFATAHVIALLLLGGLAACDGTDPVTPGEPVDLSGTYAAATGEDSRFGAVTFTVRTTGGERDMLAEGASIVLALREDGSTTGRVFVPGSGAEEELDADLGGTWTEEDGVVRLDHAADTFLRDMDFAIDDDRLVGDAEFDGVDVQVSLDPVSPEAIGDLGSEVEEFEITAEVDIDDSFPAQLAGTMTFHNPGDESRTLVTGVCWPLLRAYDMDEDVVVWDQLEEGACALFTPQIDVIGPGGSKVFETPVATAADVLDAELPDGTYRLAVYFSTVRVHEIELDAGEFELAIPR